MPLVASSVLLQAAARSNYAVPAFNFHSLVDLQAILRAAEEEAAPVIVMASEGTIEFAGVGYIQGMAEAAAEEVKIPFALHLDHARSRDNVIRCLRYGFTSIMFDGSRYPLEENIELTRWVTDICHRAGVPVEGELGRIPGVEEDIEVAQDEAGLTDPDTVAEYVEKTQVDALAVAIGSAHGFYKGEPKLDFDRLQAIRKMTDVPLVLHGGTGIPDEMVKKAIELGIRKVNIGTEVKWAYTDGMRQNTRDKEIVDPRHVLTPTKERIAEVVRQKIRLCGAAGRARNSRSVWGVLPT